MRILVIQFASAVRHPPPRFEPQLGALLALLKQRGHTLTLLGVSRFDERLLKEALARQLPQLIYADIDSVCSDIARRTLQHLEGHEFLPVVAGGLFASLAPETALSFPGVVAVALGEPDASLVTYLERFKDPAIGQVTQGVWLRDERGLARPSMPALIEDLDSIPFPDRELFNANRANPVQEIEIAIGRGCQRSYGYSPDAALAALYSNHNAWARRRSVANVLEELSELKTRYPSMRRVRFLNDEFTSDLEWLRVFASEYRAGDRVPFRCRAAADSVSEEVVELLTSSGCEQVDIDLISGSDFIRNEVFQMSLSEEQIQDAVARLTAARIRVVPRIFVGCPYEGIVSLDETARLLRRVQPVDADIRPYYPMPGTPAAELAREMGWLHPRGEEQYHADRCGLDLPACRPAIVDAALQQLRGEFGENTPNGNWWRIFNDAARSIMTRLAGRQSQS